MDTLQLTPHAGNPLAAEFARLLADQAKLNERAFRLMALACAGAAPVALADPSLATPVTAPPAGTSSGEDTRNDVLELYGVPAPEPAPAPAPETATPEPTPAAPPTEREAAVAGGILAAGLSPARVAAAAGAALATKRDPKPVPTELSETARQRKDRVLDAYVANPGTVAEMADRVNLSTPIISAILSAARQAGDTRVTRGDAGRREAKTAAGPTKKSLIYGMWARTTDPARVVAERLGMTPSNVGAHLSLGRTAKDPLVLAGDKARLEAARTAAAPKATAGGEPPAPAAAPPPPAPAAAELPPPSHVDEAAPVTPANIAAALTPRLASRPAAAKKPTSVGKMAPEPLPAPANPVQARARAVLRAKILDAYEETGDHPRRLAARLGATLREVDWFLHDARQAADGRVRLGDMRRARQGGLGK